MPHNHAVSPFHIEQADDESCYHLALPEEATKSRLTIYEKSICSLPLPPALWNAFQQACKREASAKQLGMIIKDDPVLSAAILRIANAPGLGVRVEINDVGRAVTHLGISLVRSIVSKHSFASGFNANCKVYDIKKLWKHGMAVSALAEVVAEFIPNCDAEAASTLGLFHDIGKMTLNLFPEYMLPALLDAEQGHLIYEYKRFSCTHIDLGIVLAKHWELPDSLTQGIAYHHHPAFADMAEIPEAIRSEVFAVYLADMMAIHLGFGTGDSGMVMPHDSFSDLLVGTNLSELMASTKVQNEIKRIESVGF